MVKQVKHIRTSKKGKRFIAGSKKKVSSKSIEFRKLAKLYINVKNKLNKLIDRTDYCECIDPVYFIIYNEYSEYAEYFCGKCGKEIA